VQAIKDEANQGSVTTVNYNDDDETVDLTPAKRNWYTKSSFADSVINSLFLSDNEITEPYYLTRSDNRISSDLSETGQSTH
jgi:hypothetical protein